MWEVVVAQKIKLQLRWNNAVAMTAVVFDLPK
jgi:hypothetical protein